jgi:hypothetical protein
MTTVGPNIPAREFAYIAFDLSSGRAIAHGRRANDALDSADRVRPDIGILILATGPAGHWIWNDEIPLEEARVALDKMSPATDLAH